jgi:spore coat polysaccharide biosynthesis predicted glycosyltransferase SpsG
MAAPRIQLVTRAGRLDGRGHATRAATIAEALAHSGASASVAFLAGGPTPAETRRLGSVDVGIAALDPDADLWVVDMPRPDEVAPRLAQERMVVFDDNESYRGRAALVIQPSAPTWSGGAQADRVLAGYEWAPIGPAWRELDGAERAEPTGKPRVLVCFGGSDPADVTSRLGAPIAEDTRWSTTAVVGHGYDGSAPDGAVERDPPDLPARVAAAEIVLSGAGTMKFEIAHLGRPALLVAVADDQLAVGPAFAATGAARWLGDGRTIDPEHVRTAVSDLLADAHARAEMSDVARGLVDGRGADRLAVELIRLAADTRSGLAGAGRREP